MKYPKVLIICAGIDESGAIQSTLLNLFINWPKEHLLLAGYDYANRYKDYFGNAFILEESPPKLPKRILSGKLKNLDLLKKTLKAKHHIKIIQNNPIDSNTFNALVSWIKEQNPDVIYGMIGGSLPNIPYVLSLMEALDYPFVIHIADDWVTRDFFGLFRIRFDKYLHAQFSKMLKLASTVLCISKPMANEYKRRYGIDSHVFHNPVPKSLWDQVMLPEKKQQIRIAYFGSIEEYYQDGLIKLNSAINILKKQGIDAKGEAIGKIKNTGFEKMAKKLRNIEFKGFIPYSELPNYISEIDILFLPFSFRKKFKRVRYSMPTKLTEYMYCPQPFIVFAPQIMALTQFALENNIAMCITKNNAYLLAKIIRELVQNNKLSYTMANKSKTVAQQMFVTEVVSERFRKIFEELT